MTDTCINCEGTLHYTKCIICSNSMHEQCVLTCSYCHEPFCTTHYGTHFKNQKVDQCENT